MSDVSVEPIGFDWDIEEVLEEPNVPEGPILEEEYVDQPDQTGEGGQNYSDASDQVLLAVSDEASTHNLLAGNDQFTGSNGAEIVYGGAGNDNISGAYGNDSLFGGTGLDFLYGGFGDDTIYGEDGDDLVYGGRGNDSIDAGTGFAVVEGGDGDDVIRTGLSRESGFSANVFGGAGGDLIYVEGAAYIDGGTGIDTVYGGDGDDVIVDQGGIDTLFGGGGNDNFLLGGNLGQTILDGGEGLDGVVYQAETGNLNINLAAAATIMVRGGTAQGDRLTSIEWLASGSGADILRGNSSDNRFFGRSGDDDLFGADGNDSLFGEEGHDELFGESGDDLLSGGAGTDTLDGGAGEDRLIARSLDGDIIRGGDDLDVLVFSSNRGDYLFEALGNVLVVSHVSNGGTVFVETVERFEFLDRTLSYHELFIVPGLTIRGNGPLNGGEGNDSVYGGIGNDTLTGFAGDDILFASSGNDRLYGGVGFDNLSGGVGNDYLDGGRDQDYMAGGSGNDVYIVVAGDTVLEAVNAGIDTVRTAGSYILGSNLDNLALTGKANINGTGNGLANWLTGNAENNVLNGGLGNDTMVGGAGNDTYVVNATGDMVFETTTTDSTINAGGIDTVRSTVTFNLDAYAGVRFVERLTLAGAANVNGSGNLLDNTMTGNAGSNFLNGGLGNDVLIGGLGRDTFAFNSAIGAGNVDIIADFTVIDDTIRLDDETFVGLPASTLVTSAFAANLSGNATDGLDRIIYETDTGRLYFDADGSGVGGRIHFSTLSANLSLTSADFFVF